MIFLKDVYIKSNLSKDLAKHLKLVGLVILCILIWPKFRNSQRLKCKAKNKKNIKNISIGFNTEPKLTIIILSGQSTF
jgi:hypothetical protein